MEVRGKKLEVRGKKLEVRGKKLEVKSHKLELGGACIACQRLKDLKCLGLGK